jgi:hypothetical protein
MLSTVIRPAAVETPADWVVRGLQGLAESVPSVVPAGFDVYLRVFHRGHAGRSYRHFQPLLLRVVGRIPPAAGGNPVCPSILGVDWLSDELNPPSTR